MAFLSCRAQSRPAETASEPDAEREPADETGNTLIVGGGVNYAFGSMWYGGTKDVNDVTNYCQNGKCQFNRGLRVFCLLEFVQSSADGVTFALINGNTNDKYSVGGDSALGELLAYAGDSRKYPGSGVENWPRNFTYVHGVTATTPNGTPGGLNPPKMALEFDTWYNGNTSWCCFTPPTTFCSTRENAATRYDPPTTLSNADTKDYVQFIFWGENRNENYDYELYPDCNKVIGTTVEKTYDDNKHAVGDNDRDLFFTYENLSDAEKATIPATQVEQNNWLGTAANNRRWALRFTVKRGISAIPVGEDHAGEYAYTLNMWLRKCTTADCSDILNTEYARTWVDYRARTAHMTQTIYLTESQHQDFERTIFGFTEATGSATQILNINDFELTFIRPGQRVVLDDPDWP